MPSERSDEELYLLVRRAVADAIWDVLGTVALSVVYAALLLVGLRMLVALWLSPQPTVRGLPFVVVALLLVVGSVAGLLRLWDLRPFGASS